MKTLSLIVLSTLFFSFSSQADVFCEDLVDGSVSLKIDTANRANLIGNYSSGAFSSKIKPVQVEYRGLKALYKFKAGGLDFELNIFYGVSPVDNMANDAMLTYSRPNEVTNRLRMQCSGSL